MILVKEWSKSGLRSIKGVSGRICQSTSERDILVHEGSETQRMRSFSSFVRLVNGVALVLMVKSLAVLGKLVSESGAV